MTTKVRNIDRIVSTVALVMSVATLLLTSPVLIDVYIKPKLIIEATKIDVGGVNISIGNRGYKKASGIVIEFADLTNLDNFITKIHFIPPKEYEIVHHFPFTMIKVRDAILPDELVGVSLYCNIADSAFPYLWIRVRSDERDYGWLRAAKK